MAGLPTRQTRQLPMARRDQEARRWAVRNKQSHMLKNVILHWTGKLFFDEAHIFLFISIISVKLSKTRKYE